MKYRVVKVNLEGHGVKYAPQYKTKTLIELKKILFFIPFKTVEYEYRWKNLYEVSKGTDELIPCYYNTQEEAWDRIDKTKYNMELDCKKYKILEEYYA
jgi:hypothetical protein